MCFSCYQKTAIKAFDSATIEIVGFLPTKSQRAERSSMQPETRYAKSGDVHIA